MGSEIMIKILVPFQKITLIMILNCLLLLEKGFKVAFNTLISDFVSMWNLSPQYQTFFSQVFSQQDPASVQEALTSETMNEERR